MNKKCIICSRDFTKNEGEVFMIYSSFDGETSICQCLNHEDLSSNEEEVDGFWVVAKIKNGQLYLAADI